MCALNQKVSDCLQPEYVYGFDQGILPSKAKPSSTRFAHQRPTTQNKNKIRIELHTLNYIIFESYICQQISTKAIKKSLC